MTEHATAERANDLIAFRKFIDEQLAAGGRLTLDDALALWEIENQSDAERAETLAAIQRGLEDMHAGRTVDAFEFVERMRQTLESRVER